MCNEAAITLFTLIPVGLAEGRYGNLNDNHHFLVLRERPRTKRQDIVFIDDDNNNQIGVSQTTEFDAIPGMETPRTPCEDACRITPQYNPVCGTDNVTYFNNGRLRCAQKCGKRVVLKNLGICSLG